MTDKPTPTLADLVQTVAALQQRVEKLDRLVYKLFKRLPRPVQKTAPHDQ